MEYEVMNEVCALTEVDDGQLGDVKQQPDFASVCSFIHHFGPDLGIYLTFPQLESYFRLEERLNWKKWETLHIKLLHKLRYRVRSERWAPALARFVYVHAWNMESLCEAANRLENDIVVETKPEGDSKWPEHVPSHVYYQLDVSTRIKLLLVLLETQFDRNQKFKEKVNIRSAEELRYEPLGYDAWGRIYWLLKDSEINFLLYREDAEQESLQLLCQTTDQLRELSIDLKDICPQDKELSVILVNATNKVSSNSPISKSQDEQLEKLENDQLDETVVPDLIESQQCELPPSPKTPPATPINPLVNQATALLASDLICKLERIDDVDEKSNGLDEVIKQDTELYNGDNEAKYPSVVNHVKEESVDITTAKSKKRGVKRNTVNADTTEPPFSEVRRSGRQRKQVEFLKMEPLHSNSMKNKATVKDSTPTAAPLKVEPKKKKCNKKSDELPKKIDVQPIENSVHLKKKKRRKRKHKRNGKSKYPWAGHSSSSSESEDDDDTFEKALEHHYANDSGSDYEDGNSKKRNEILDALAWLDKPESDFNADDSGASSDVDSLTLGRNLARQKRLQRKSIEVTANKVVSENCQICHKSNHPEWILLCDRCDLGHHAMCLCPPLFVIPEGDWYCPRCRHAALLTVLTACADKIDDEQKKQTVWKRMQERLNYVNISMTNILADDEDDGVEKSDHRKCRKIQASYADGLDESSYQNEMDEVSSNDTDYLSSYDRRHLRRKAHRSYETRKRQRNGHRRFKYRDYSSQDESQFSSIRCAPRSSRQRGAKYNVNEAFKLLDEALEDDDKYQEEKRLRTIKGDESAYEIVGNGTEDSHLSAHESAEIDAIGPVWKVVPKKTRKHNRLSSSSEESDGQFETKRRSKNADADFKPAADDDDDSGSDEEESVDGSDSESNKSDQSWFCSTRRANAVSRRSRRKFIKPRSSRRPVPRFEASDDDVSDNSEPSHIAQRRRSARGVISYKESEDESSNSDRVRECSKRKRLDSNHGSSSDDENTHSPNHSNLAGHRKRCTRVLSDSDYEADQPSPNENNKSAPEDSEHGSSETDNDDGSKNLTIDESSPTARSDRPSPTKSTIFDHPNPTTKQNSPIEHTKFSSDPVTTNVNLTNNLPTDEINSPDMFE